VSGVTISESSLFRMFAITWFVVFLSGVFFVFPFGFVFSAIFGVFIGMLVTWLYVFSMELAFGEHSRGREGRSFNFLRGKHEREGEEKSGSNGFLDKLFGVKE